MDDTIHILEKKHIDTLKSSNIVVLKGESGIGKSYYVNKFLETLPDKDSVIKFDAHSTEISDYNTLNTTIYKLISNSKIKKEITINVLQKLALWIPRFGQKISMMIDTNLASKSLNDLVRRAGINTQEPRVLEIMKFLENFSSCSPIVVYCDNVQWFDKGSWNILLQLFSLVKARNWYCILSYTTNATNPVIHYDDFEEQLYKLEKTYEINKISIHTIQRWRESNIKILCDSILMCTTKFSPSQYSLIYEYSQGVPLFVRTILSSLMEGNYIQFSTNSFISQSDWNLDDIHDILKNSVKNKILKVYHSIPESRELLEFGSVIDDDFSDESLESVFDTDCSNVLREVEKRFRLIEYLLENRLWKFEHFLIQDYIYHSLGNKAKDIHLKIANYLENNRDKVSNLKISLHYKLAGNYEKSAFYFIKEIESLLDSGCYVLASDKMNYLDDNYASELIVSLSLRYHALFLKGRILFHTVQYQSAIEVFTQLIKDIPHDYDELIGSCHQWLARSFLKLNTQNDFNSALSHLHIAKSKFTKTEKYSELGDILLDFIVAYAHMNQKNMAEVMYKEAERYFNMANDRIGMLRLHRKCIIFMSSKLAAPVLKNVAKSWERLNIPHEEIMALTNAAVEYLDLCDYKEAETLLLKALDVSVDLDGFGQVYIYNNLSILNIYQKDYARSDENANEARKGKFRFVEQLIVDVNKSALIALRDGVDSAFPFIERAYVNALIVNENDYTVPASINWGIVNFKNGNIQFALELLISQETCMTEYYNNYIFVIWYDTVYKCFLATDKDKAETFSQKYNKKVEQYLKTHSDDYPKYALIPMEFWSEN